LTLLSIPDLNAVDMKIAPSKERPSAENGTPYYKMKDLVSATGIPKSTILLYVNKGLLPQPVRPVSNVAYYHPDCVQRIAFIRRVQSSHRLPLAAIKGLLKEVDRGKDVNALLDLQTLLFAGGDDERLDAQDLAGETGLSANEVAALVNARLLVPLEDGCFDREDVAVGKLLKSGLQLGFKIEELAFYPRMADQIVANELDLRLRHTRDLAFEEDAALTLEMTPIARGLRAYIIDRVMQRRLIRSHLKKVF
jgi:DNA-binding transcriptional MerR regulator